MVRLLKSGAVGFMPSDTIYGLSARAGDQAAVERLHRVKERSRHKPFVILFSKYEQLADIGVDQAVTDRARVFWPGRVSFVVPAPAAPYYLHLGRQSLALRQPDDIELTRLIDAVGPIISTSANHSGARPLHGAAQAQVTFGDELDFYIDRGDIHGLASTIVTVEQGKLKILRQGAVKIMNEEKS